MKLAFLMQCHKSPQQINIMLDVLKNKNITFFIHVDKKSSMINDIIKREDVVVLPDEYRVDVKWGTFSQVEATLKLIEYSTRYEKFDYYFLISGQCFPIVSADKIVEFLTNGNSNYINLFKSLNNGAKKHTNYDKRNEIIYPEWMFRRTLFYKIIRRCYVALTGGYGYTLPLFKRKAPDDIKFYFGSSWWCLKKITVLWMMEYITNNPDFIKFYQKSCCPDESFFQTLYMRSPYFQDRKDYLHYIDWSEGKSSPKNLEYKDYEHVISSDKLMARKIDGNEELINALLKKVRTGE